MSKTLISTLSLLRTGKSNKLVLKLQQQDQKNSKDISSSLKFTFICTSYSFIYQGVIFYIGIISFHFMSNPANYIL